MWASLMVARELLRCRLKEGGRDTLLERVAELLDAAASGAPPFCYLLPSRAATGPHDGPRYNRAPSGAPGGIIGPRTADDTVGPVALAPPLVGTGTSVAPHGPSGASRLHPQDAALGRATWSVGHYGEVFGVTAPEAYVPRMMD